MNDAQKYYRERECVCVCVCVCVSAKREREREREHTVNGTLASLTMDTYRLFFGGDFDSIGYHESCSLL